MQQGREAEAWKPWLSKRPLQDVSSMAMQVDGAQKRRPCKQCACPPAGQQPLEQELSVLLAGLAPHRCLSSSLPHASRLWSAGQQASGRGDQGKEPSGCVGGHQPPGPACRASASCRGTW